MNRAKLVGRSPRGAPAPGRASVNRSSPPRTVARGGDGAHDERSPLKGPWLTVDRRSDPPRGGRRPWPPRLGKEIGTPEDLGPQGPAPGEREQAAGLRDPVNRPGAS